MMKCELIDHMGSDLSVVDAARVSFAKKSKWVVDYEDESYDLSEEDQRLIQYLAKHNHWSPFAHTAITLRVGAPVPIRTQAFKHKTGMVENEESRRYIKSTPELFIPDEFRHAPVKSIKQGSGGKHYDSDYWLERYTKECKQAISTYEEMIKDNMCPEQARFILPQGIIVNWIWTGNLVSFSNFYNKRIDPMAQKEVQDLAKKVGSVVENIYPHSWKALTSC